MAAKNLSTIWSFLVFNEAIFFFHQTKFFICYSSLSCEMSPDLTQLDRGPPGLSGDNSGGKLLIKFDGSQGAQHV